MQTIVVLSVARHPIWTFAAIASSCADTTGSSITTAVTTSRAASPLALAESQEHKQHELDSNFPSTYLPNVASGVARAHDLRVLCVGGGN